MRYDASQCTGQCKTCGITVEPGAVRCDEHEEAFQRWLLGGSDSSPSAYKPRLNGVSDWERDVTPGLKFRRRTRAPLPTEPLKFD